MTARVWHTGKPPHVGWWNASVAGDLTDWRWWDGRHWSCNVCNINSAFYANETALLVTIYHERLIRWTTYWPKNARVSRINPETGEVTGGKK